MDGSRPASVISEEISESAAPTRKHNQEQRLEVRVAHSMDEVQMALAVRSAVFLAEASCPYAEEFDGNDFGATHILGLVDGEPAATIRIRYFGGFAKMERMAIRREYRGLPLAMKVAHYAIEFVRKKGFGLFVTHMQTGDDRERLWRLVYRRYGGYRQIPGLDEFSFSDHNFLPIQVSVPESEEAFRFDTDPHVMNRPEGDWDRPGVLELGAGALPVPSRKLRS